MSKYKVLEASGYKHLMKLTKRMENSGWEKSGSIKECHDKYTKFYRQVLIKED